jgi:hypothetical protein
MVGYEMFDMNEWTADSLLTRPPKTPHYKRAIERKFLLVKIFIIGLFQPVMVSNENVTSSMQVETNYSIINREVPYGYWGKLISSIATWDKITEETISCDYDAFA